MNLLVYMGLCNYDLPEAREALVQKSLSLILKECSRTGTFMRTTMPTRVWGAMYATAMPSIHGADCWPSLP